MPFVCFVFCGDGLVLIEPLLLLGVVGGSCECSDSEASVVDVVLAVRGGMDVLKVVVVVAALVAVVVVILGAAAGVVVEESCRSS